MSDTPDTWLAAQSAAVRAELENLLGYRVEPEFLQELGELLPIVPRPGLIDLYYDIFYCCPPVFRIAVQQLHTPEELADFLQLAERALLDATDTEAFAAAGLNPLVGAASAANAQGADQDSRLKPLLPDIDEVIFWLKRRVQARS